MANFLQVWTAWPKKIGSPSGWFQNALRSHFNPIMISTGEDYQMYVMVLSNGIVI